MAKAPDAFVVDASVLLALVLPDTLERKRHVLSLIGVAQSGGPRLLVPQLCQTEMAAALMRAMRAPSGALGSDTADEFFGIVEQLGIEVIADGYSARDICAFAQRVGCQAADAVYLMLARDTSAGIASRSMPDH